jgi:hypothetical protein
VVTPAEAGVRVRNLREAVALEDVDDDILDPSTVGGKFDT